jgi:hypothetical protein
MKKIIFLLIAISYTLCGYAQRDESARRWFIGINYKVGKLDEKIDLRSLGLIYPSAANFYQSELKIKNDNPTAFDVQIGYYFDKKAHWGISTGIVYFKNTGTLTIDSMHVEYKSSDFNNDDFRQVVSSTKPMKENLENTNISIPLLLKYRGMLSKRIGFTMDAGIVYNVKMESTYSSDAAFDYEAIYRFEKVNGQDVAVYDHAAMANANDWFITKNEYYKDKGDGKEAAYFQDLRDQGYNVALDENAKAKSTTVAHKTGSIGLLLQPSLSFKLSNTFQLNVGPYLMYQRFLNAEDQENTIRTPKIGEYNSILNNSVNRRNVNYGANIGLSMFL